MIDCLIIGFNDSNFADYVTMVKSMGTDSGAFKDLDLAFIEYRGKPYRSMDILNHFHSLNGNGRQRPFHNADFLWPVVTCLVSYLSKRNLNVDFVNLFHLEKDKLKEKLLRNDILTIAITTTLYVSPQPILEIISFIRKYNQTAKIIVGGPHIANSTKTDDPLASRSLLKYMGADYYVISAEGEGALVKIIHALKTGSELDGIDNVAFKRGKDYLITATSLESNPLEENMVDYRLFSRDQIGEFVSTRTAKSCPFSCAFCAFPARAGKYTYSDVAIVERELDAIRDIGGVTTVSFIDDTFNVPKARFKEILRMMIKNKYGFKWNSTYRCDHGDDEAVALMRDAGCEGVFLGVESGSDVMLKIMNKSAKRADYMHAIPSLAKAGISTYASLVLGFPGETEQTVQETIDLLDEAKPDYFRAQLWYCDPLTPIWDDREKYGIKGCAFSWSHDTMEARTACDLIDKMFLSVEGSIWLPQNGFEQWSTFYLQRKGMTTEQIKTFLRCFNAVIKDKIISAPGKGADPNLLESLMKSCQFDTPTRPDLGPVERLSGARYLAAERYWTSEFGDHRPVVATSAPEVTTARADRAGNAAIVDRIEGELLASLRARHPNDLASVFLSVFSWLLCRLNRSQETLMLSSTNDPEMEGVLPLRLSTAKDLDFNQLIGHTKARIEGALEHQRYALHVLTKVRELPAQATSLKFDAGYHYTAFNGLPGITSLEGVLKSYPSIDREIGPVLQIDEGAESIKIQFAFSKKFNRDSMEQMKADLLTILQQLSDRPAGFPTLPPSGEEVTSRSSRVQGYASELF
jgi:anaerobic magnesium-protoporphyrin IX monomethyl ester cyclase